MVSMFLSRFLFFLFRKQHKILFYSGIVAIFYAVKSLHCECHGYYEQAFIYSRRSLAWSLTTYVIALFVFLTIGFFLFIRTIEHH